ncbi:uncharacterized protein LOC116177252 [Photinus pyralis]|nr:uncharacterized protein LOC116160129 [Photinus pyralis]XP_031352029.1 uncharacterized protein LOC116177252 [Photinus pyralis]
MPDPQVPVEGPTEHLDRPMSTINRVAVKPPPFWKSDPSLWFRQLEAQFHISGITDDTTRFYTAVAAIDTQILSQVSDIINDPPPTDSESEERRLQKLLGAMELGDLKPSQLMLHLRNLGGSRIGNDILKSLWLARLPQQHQAILAVSTQDLDQLVSMADKLHEVYNQYSISEVSRSQSSAASPVDLEATVAQLASTVKDLAATVSTLQTQDRVRYRQRTRSRPRTPNHNAESRPEHCWYHRKFGSRAKNCYQPCSYQASNSEN